MTEEDPDNIQLPVIAGPSAKRLPVRSSQDIVRQDVTQELESLAEHEPERLAEIVREWIKEKS